MTKYREIIRLYSLKFNASNIALSCSVSRNTVSKVLERAEEINISWPIDETMTNETLTLYCRYVMYSKFELNKLLFTF